MDKISEFLRLFKIDDENDEEFLSDGELLDMAYDIICALPRLKPCPFCGSPAEYGSDGDLWFVVCDKCGAQSDAGSEEDVTKLWNSRA